MSKEKRLVPHPQEFEVLRPIFKRAKVGQNHQEIAAALTSRKLRPRAAKAWTRFAVRQIVLWHAERSEVLQSAERRNFSDLAQGVETQT